MSCASKINRDHFEISLYTMEEFVFKKTLKSILADEDLIAQINKLAADVSIIQFLATHHLHKRSMEIILSEDPVRIRAEFDREIGDAMFHDDFFAVKANTRVHVADPDFLAWMANCNPPVFPPDAVHSAQTLKHAMKTYKTNFSNNIKLRAKQMFRKFCKAVLYSTGRVWPRRVLNKIINDAIDWFFYFTTYEPRPGSPVQIIIEEFIWHMTIDDEPFVRGCLNGSLDGRNFYRFAKYFIKMQLYVHHYNGTHPNRIVKSFSVIPLHSYHRRFVMIDTETMREMTQMRIIKNRPNSRGNLNPRKSDVWSFFYLDDVDYKRDNQRFDHKIMSDGETANIFMMKLNPHELHVDMDDQSKIKGVLMRPMDQPVCEKFDRIPAEVAERINEFDVKIGIDPGAKTMAAWTKQYPTGDEECFSIESKTFREMAGFRTREYERRKITRWFDRREREAREASEIPITSKCPNYAEFVQHKLQFCNEGIDVYHHPYVRKLKFDAHQKKLAAMYAVAKRIIGRSANRLNEALIFFGHWRWTANSPIRGIRTPLKLLRFCLEQLGSTVIVIHEYRTSKLCNFCAKTMISEDRNSLCIDCQPIERTLAPATFWRMKAHKSYIKRHPFAPKIRTYERDPNQPMRRNNQGRSQMNWNRDYNASRAILSKGLDFVAGRPLPRNYLTTTRVAQIVTRRRR